MPFLLCYYIIKSYLKNKYFVVRRSNDLSFSHLLHAGVPQDNNLTPDLYNVFTANIPLFIHTLLAAYDNDTAILTINANPNQVTKLLQD